MAIILGGILLFGTWVQAEQELLVDGRVRLDSGEPAAGAQVLLFDLSDLAAPPVAATTDEAGYFAMPEKMTSLPERFSLGQSYPNPFNSTTIIPYQLPVSCRVLLEVFNILGQHIATLVDGERSAGFHTVQWNATDSSGKAVATGVYLYRLSANGVRLTRRMMLIDGGAGGLRGAGRGHSPAGRDEASGTVKVYGLTVSGQGLVTFVDPAFRLKPGLPINLVVQKLESVPRAKVATVGILGDVNNDHRVDIADAVLVLLYSDNASINLPNNGNIAQGDVNGDGRTDRSDAWRIFAFSVDPSDPSLPEGIGSRLLPRPDLAIYSVVVSSTNLLAREPFTLSVAVRNQGGAMSPATVLRYYRSTNGTISSKDRQVGTDPVGTLSSAATRAESVRLTAPSTPGTYFYGACVRTVSGETVTGNNCSQAVRVTVRRGGGGGGGPGGPDLVVESISIEESLEAGERFTLSATVRNQGSDRAASTTLRYYRSTDPTISTMDMELDTDYVSRLAANETSEESGYLTAPLSGGIYYYGACVDGVSGETDTGNNCSVALTLAIGSPDLVVESLSIGDLPEAGERFSISATVRNRGTGRSAATTLRYYRSTDATIDTTDTELDTDYVSRVAANETSEETAYLTAPSSGGTYYYGACVDGVTAESNTGNNCSEALTLAIGSPDLVVESLSIGDLPEAGERFTLSATVRNRGTGGSAATTLRYYRSTDATIDTTDTELDTDYVSRVAANETSEETAYLTAPSSGGIYYYGACVDGVTAESNTGNNCSEALTLGIGIPDLVVEPLSVGKRPEAGERFSIHATVRNRGTGGSAATTLRYYRSTDATIDTTDTELDTDYVSRVAANETSEETVYLTAPSSGGTYYYGACVDGVTAESNTGNNCSKALTLAIGIPDLVVESLSIGDLPEAGERFTLSATVRNLGTGRSAATTLRYYRSTDATIDTNDAPVNTDYVSRLAANETSEETGYLTAPSSSGTYYYGACVDGVTAENDTGNNCSEALTLGIGSPDLTVESPEVSRTTLTSGQFFILSATVRNLGTGRSAATTLRYYRSTDATIDTNDAPVNTDYVSRLEQAGISEESSRLNAPSDEGTYYYGACVEPVLGESNTQNNCSGSVTVEIVETILANQGPTFPEGSNTTRAVAENTVGIQDLGDPVGAVDTDRDRLIYALEGDDAGSFDIVPGSGQLRTKPGVSYDYERKRRYSVRVQARDGQGGSAAIAVRVDVEDVDEVPAQPAAPTVTASTLNSLSLRWTPPANSGPEISDYDVQYRAGAAGRFTAWDHRGTSTTTTITGLVTGSDYEVQVRASSEEGRGEWSPSAHGMTTANQAPAFIEGEDILRSLAENTTGIRSIGQPIGATDTDRDPLTYTLEGPDEENFDIVSSNGQLRTRPNVTYDYETKQSHAVRVRVEDRRGGSATTEVTINVEDTDEAPGRPDPPRLSVSTLNSFSVAWSAPENTGPDISDYDVRYKKSGGRFIDWDHLGTVTATSIRGLVQNSRYEVQVRASNDEGSGDWSASVHGTTTANQAPAFSESSPRRSVVENTKGAQIIGDPVRATDEDGGTLTYSLEGTDAASFDIESSSGQLQTRPGVAYDHETKSTYSLRVRAGDGQGATAAIAVTIDVEDVDEPPGQPGAPVVTTSTSTSLSLGWSAPDNTGPALSDYHVQYRSGSSGGFTPWDHTGRSTSTTITGLITGRDYQVQVRASNDEGTGEWSPSGSGRTTSNQAPAFSESSPRRMVAENTPGGRNLGNPVAATDPDGDRLTYSLEGPEAANFDILSSSGQLRTRSGVIYDHEAKGSYSLRVRVEDGKGGRATTVATIIVENEDEPPGRPSAPAVTASTLNSLSLRWTEPDNTGPAISDYDVQYRSGASGPFTPWDHGSASTATTITGLATGTTYEVQVRARNSEGDSPWSPSGSGRTTANQAPVFSESSPVRVVTENTPASRDIEHPVTATDGDGDPLTYSLEGADAANFAIGSSNGQLRTRSGVVYDYETKDSHSLRVRVEDGRGGSAATEVMIRVEDEDEPPDRPAAPTVIASTLNSLSLRWVRPENTGPTITDYDVQYRDGGSGPFSPWAHDSTSTATTITGLATGTAYEVQVRARSPEGDSPWSPSGNGRTTANQAPTFNESSPARVVGENTPASRDIEYPVAATDGDGDPLTYSLEGADAASFTVVPGNGQLRTRSGVTYDYEVRRSYSVQMRVEDGQGGSATIPVSITVTDELEPPDRPSAPTLSAFSLNSLSARWTAPGNTGPTISGYDVQYRAGGSGAFTSWPHHGSGTTATITGLAAGTSYEVQVRAINEEGTGAWSPSGNGRTTANQAPTFTEGSAATRSLAENTTGIHDLGLPVTATDGDGGTLSYSLEGGDAASFSIVSGSGQLRTRSGLTYDYEVKDSYSVRVRAEDGQGGSTAIAVSIQVGDRDEPPGRPTAPTVAVSTTNSLNLRWTAPDNSGPAISDYDVQYRAGGIGAFTSWPHHGSGTTATITGLATGTSYEVQVRAINDEGTGAWSPSGNGRTTANQAPTFTEGSAATRSLAENTTGIHDLGLPVRATDGDGGTLSYSLEGGDAASFSIVSGSGQLRTRSGLTYDYEVKDSYSVRVRAEDGQGGSATAEVTISVGDVDEPPGRPASPKVSALTSNSLSVHWTDPDNSGPAISDYDVQYRAGSSGAFTDWSTDSDSTATTITGLATGTSYEVQVRAINEEGTGAWSPSGKGRTTANQAPAFSESSPRRVVTENTPAGQDIGNPVTATDGDGDPLTYTLGGADVASFAIDPSNGQFRTRPGVIYDHESKNSHQVQVLVEDGQGGRAASEVAISVKDVDEPPSRPSTPRVTGSTLNSLTVRWTAPDNTGPPIGDYDVQYRSNRSGGFTPWDYDSTATTTTITGLATGTSYEVQVRATNDEGTGAWSSSGNGRTTTNQAPTFSEGSRTSRRLSENTTGTQDIGRPVSATDGDGGTLTYSLEGADAASFTIADSTGQLRTLSEVGYDYEKKISYSVQLRVEDGQGGSATIAVSINVTDENEPPGRPSAPTVTASTSNSLTLTWTAPDNTGPPIGRYDVQYRSGRSGAFSPWNHDSTSTTTTITGLVTGTAYEVQVRAINDEGTGAWSPSGNGRTTTNQAPTFTEGSAATRSLAENTPAGRDLGSPVSATDRDGGTLSYSLEGTDAARFTIASSTGQLRTLSGVDYDYEKKDSYSVQVRVEDGQGGSATIAVSINVTDEIEPPGRPSAPTFTASTSSSLTLAWTAPDNPGPAIKGYDLQYRTGTGSFANWNHPGTGTTAEITGLDAGTAYEVQVRAINDEGTGPWSPSGDGTTASNQVPSFTEGSATTRSLAENTPAGRDIGSPVSATDRDGGILTYSLEGSDGSSFDLDPNSGQLRVRAGVTYNYEADDRYSVRVKVQDGQGGSAAIDVEIGLTDEIEPPGQPSAPVVTGSTSNSLSLTWTAPDNTGPAISGYGLQYRTGSNSFTSWNHSGTGTTATITGLSSNTAYEVQVRAANDEGTGDWSSSASGTTSRPGFAPADQEAFNRFVADRVLSTEEYFVEFPADDRFEENDRFPGSHSYSNTGANSGTLTQYYDAGNFGGSCTLQLSFSSTATGTSRYKCGTQETFGSWKEWRLSPSPDPNSFDIEISWVGPEPSQANRAAFEAAVAKWERVITGDIPDVFVATAGTIDGEKVFGLADDLLIYARLAEIDGPGDVLASAGPLLWRRQSNLPAVSQMSFDTADLSSYTPAALQDVVLHEMAHALGFGVLWEEHGLLEDPSLHITVEDDDRLVVTTVEPTPDTHFSGPKAIAAFNAAGGSSYTGEKVPVENELGGLGTQDGHWRRSVFGPFELMEGFGDPEATVREQMSAITIQSMADLGYEVDSGQADSYTLPSQMAAKLAIASTPLIRLNCLIPDPIGAIDELEPIQKKPWPSRWQDTGGSEDEEPVKKKPRRPKVHER